MDVPRAFCAFRAISWNTSTVLLVYGDIHVMSYSLFEGFVSGQVPDQATKSGWLKKGAQSCSVSRVAAGCMTPALLGTAFHTACARHLRFTPRMRVRFMCSGQGHGQGPRVQGFSHHVTALLSLLSSLRSPLGVHRVALHCSTPHYG